MKGLRAYEDWSENIVQIMRHAARQCADAFQALRAQQLRFEFLLLGDVGADNQNRVRCTIRSADQRSVAVGYDLPAVFGQFLDFLVITNRAGEAQG